MTTRGHRLGSLLVGLLALAAWGCASSTESTTSATPMDVPGLAGTWQGTASGPQGLSQPVTIMIASGGTYTTTGGVYTAAGTAQVRDGKLVLTSTSTTGGQTGDRVSTAVLSERRHPSQVVQVLTGSGSSTSGPYEFEVSRPKQ